MEAMERGEDPPPPPVPGPSGSSVKAAAPAAAPAPAAASPAASPAAPASPPPPPDLERVVLDVSDGEGEDAEGRGDDEFGLVEAALSQALRPVVRRCDEVLQEADSVQVSAITSEQRRALGRSVPGCCQRISTEEVGVCLNVV